MAKKKQVDPEFNGEVRARLEYEEGLNAFASCYDVDDCTHPASSPERMSWLCGWYDARTNDNLGHIFTKYGMTHP